MIAGSWPFAINALFDLVNTYAIFKFPVCLQSWKQLSVFFSYLLRKWPQSCEIVKNKRICVCPPITHSGTDDSSAEILPKDQPPFRCACPQRQYGWSPSNPSPLPA